MRARSCLRRNEDRGVSLFGKGILREARSGRALIVASPAIVEELRGVLACPKLAARVSQLETSVAQLVESLLHRLAIVEEAGIEAVVADDPDDDHVIACAVAGRARWIVSGDRHASHHEEQQGPTGMKIRSAGGG